MEGKFERFVRVLKGYKLDFTKENSERDGFETRWISCFEEISRKLGKTCDRDGPSVRRSPSLRPFLHFFLGYQIFKSLSAGRLTLGSAMLINGAVFLDR